MYVHMRCVCKCAIPLDTSSCHPRAVHNWPVADLHRLACNSSSVHHFEVAKLETVSNYIHNSMDPGVILKVLIANPMHQRCIASDLAKNYQSEALRSRIIRITLDHHPQLQYSSFQQQLDILMQHYSQLVEFLFGYRVKLRIAWRKAGPHLYLRLRSLMLSR